MLRYIPFDKFRQLINDKPNSFNVNEALDVCDKAEKVKSNLENICMREDRQFYFDIQTFDFLIEIDTEREEIDKTSNIETVIVDKKYYVKVQKDRLDLLSDTSNFKLIKIKEPIKINLESEISDNEAKILFKNFLSQLFTSDNFRIDAESQESSIKLIPLGTDKKHIAYKNICLTLLNKIKKALEDLKIINACFELHTNNENEIEYVLTKEPEEWHKLAEKITNIIIKPSELSYKEIMDSCSCFQSGVSFYDFASYLLPSQTSYFDTCTKSLVSLTLKHVSKNDRKNFIPMIMVNEKEKILEISFAGYYVCSLMQKLKELYSDGEYFEDKKTFVTTEKINFSFDENGANSQKNIQTISINSHQKIYDKLKEAEKSWVPSRQNNSLIELTIEQNREVLNFKKIDILSPKKNFLTINDNASKEMPNYTYIIKTFIEILRTELRPEKECILYLYSFNNAQISILCSEAIYDGLFQFLSTNGIKLLKDPECPMINISIKDIQDHIISYEMNPEELFKLFNTSRDEAVTLLNEQITLIKKTLEVPIRHTLNTNDAFIVALQVDGFIDNSITAEKIRNEVKKWSKNLNVIQGYIKYYLANQDVNKGWPHPAVLFALAQIQNIKLYIWEPSGNYLCDDSIQSKNEIHLLRNSEDYCSKLCTTEAIQRKKSKTDSLSLNYSQLELLCFKKKLSCEWNQQRTELTIKGKAKKVLEIYYEHLQAIDKRKIARLNLDNFTLDNLELIIPQVLVEQYEQEQKSEEAISKFDTKQPKVGTVEEPPKKSTNEEENNVNNQPNQSDLISLDNDRSSFNFNF